MPIQRLLQVACISLLAVLLTGCHSLERLFRVSPLSGVAEQGERINLWPLFYKNGERFAVLWPIYDDDEKGFALRPLVTRDGDDWEIAPPLCWFNTETGYWVVLPAWRGDDTYGLFPLFANSETFKHIGPVNWSLDDKGEVSRYGVFPIGSFGEGFNHAGPFWWRNDRAGYGLFPLFDFGEMNHHAGPVFWGRNEGGALDYLAAVPLFAYDSDPDGSGLFLTPLGGRGWNKAGETSFVNVLGPLFHYHSEDDKSNLLVLAPFFIKHTGPNSDSLDVWPLFGRTVKKGEKGEVSDTETTMFIGLFREAGLEKTEALRMIPFFSYRSENGGRESLVDYLSLFGYKRYSKDASSLHIATPMVFNYRQSKGGDYRWSSLLGTINYEKTGDRSEFNLLYYLYRQKTVGTETQRDLFPFISWDSGEKRSGFSFLWRLIHWERTGDRVGGHFLFIPWGDI